MLWFRRARGLDADGLGGVLATRRIEYAFGRRRIACQLVRRTSRPCKKLSTTIGTSSSQESVRTRCAECALERADAGFDGIRRQVLVAALTAWPQLKHFAHNFAGIEGFEWSYGAALHAWVSQYDRFANLPCSGTRRNALVIQHLGNLRAGLARRNRGERRVSQARWATPRTRAWSAGTTSASNHGFRWSQRLLRGLGCGSGTSAGQ